MKQIIRPILALGLMAAPAALVSTPAMAQQHVDGVAVVNIPAVVANSNAYKAAEQQRTTTYAAQIQQANQRRQQIAAQLQPLVDKFNTDRAAATPNQQSLQQQAQQIQQIQQAGQAELEQMLQPVALSRAYTAELIEEQLDPALQAAVKAKNVTLVLDASQGAVVYADATYNITQDVINELNRLLPSVQVQPPAGWVPREVRQQQAAAQEAQPQQQSNDSAQSR